MGVKFSRACFLATTACIVLTGCHKKDLQSTLSALPERWSKIRPNMTRGEILDALGLSSFVGYDPIPGIDVADLNLAGTSWTTNATYTFPSEPGHILWITSRHQTIISVSYRSPAGVLL